MSIRGIYNGGGTHGVKIGSSKLGWATSYKTSGVRFNHFGAIDTVAIQEKDGSAWETKRQNRLKCGIRSVFGGFLGPSIGNFLNKSKY